MGSGDGFLGAVFQTFRVGTKVTGVETHVRQLTSPGIEPIVFDGLHLPSADSFDVAILCNVRADTQGEYLKRTHWQTMFRRVPSATVTAYEGLSLRTPPLSLAIDNSLELVFTVDVR